MWVSPSKQLDYRYLITCSNTDMYSQFPSNIFDLISHPDSQHNACCRRNELHNQLCCCGSRYHLWSTSLHATMRRLSPLRGLPCDDLSTMTVSGYVSGETSCCFIIQSWLMLTLAKTKAYYKTDSRSHNPLCSSSSFILLLIFEFAWFEARWTFLHAF